MLLKIRKIREIDYSNPKPSMYRMTRDFSVDRGMFIILDKLQTIAISLCTVTLVTSSRFALSAYVSVNKPSRLSSRSIKIESCVVLRTESCITPDGNGADDERAVVLRISELFADKLHSHCKATLVMSSPFSSSSRRSCGTLSKAL